MHSIDIIVLIVYFLFLILLFVRNKTASNSREYAVGSKSFPKGLIFATLAATIIGPGYSMGIADRAAANGYIWVAIFLGFSIQTIVVGKFIAPKIQAFKNAITLGDIMGERYGNLVKLISGILSVALSAGFVGVIARASGEIIHNITNLSFFWAITISTLFVIIYCTYGGIKTIVLGDAIQFIILVIAIPTMLIFLMRDPTISTKLVSINSNSLFSSNMNLLQIGALFVGFLLGETLVPPYAIRALMSKNETHARDGFMLAGSFSIVWFFLCASIGIIGVMIYPDSQSVFMSVLKNNLPIGITGLVIASLFSIIMSTQSSILNAAAISFNNDIISILHRGRRSDRSILNSNKILNFIIGILALFFAMNVPGIVDALMYCYTIWAPTIVLPLIIAALYSKAKPSSALFSILGGGILTGIWEWALITPMGIPSVLIGVAANQLIFWTLHLLKTDKIDNKIFHIIK